MARSGPLSVMCTYRPKVGKSKQLLTLLQRHWPTLRREGLVTSRPVQIWRAKDKRSGDVQFVETFEWRDARASDQAHRNEAVLGVWAPMEKVLDRLHISVIEPVATPRRRLWPFGR